MRTPTLLLASVAWLAISCAHGSDSAAAAPAAAAAGDGQLVKYAYFPPRNPAHQALYEDLQKRQLLEQLAEAFSLLRLPKTLTLKAQGCDGTSNAWYDSSDASVTFCYEYMAELQQLAATKDLGKVPLEDAQMGPIIFVYLHETGHAVFNLLQVPILGKEEDAADNFATVILLRLGPDFALRVLRGTAWQYAQGAQSRELDYTDFSDVHPLDVQRYYQILCLAYGSDPKSFAMVLDSGLLPKDRAEGCSEEWAQATYAMKKLIAPNMDAGKAAEYRARQIKRFSSEKN